MVSLQLARDDLFSSHLSIKFIFRARFLPGMNLGALVFGCLHPTAWKDAETIAKEICLDEGLAEDTVSAVRVVVAADGLREEGLAEFRLNYEDAARVKAREGNGVAEYRLTQTGYKRRCEPHDADLDGDLVPSTA